MIAPWLPALPGAACLACLLLACLLFPAHPIAAQEAGTASPVPPAVENPSELSLFEDIPIVVTASKKPERVTDAPSIISIITAEEIERMGARTLMDLLRTIPGFELHGDARNVTQITVRGLRSDTSSGVKVLIDGHAVNDPFTGGATEFYEDLPLANVKRIEIIRGPASAVYGANAFVSVINILTNDAADLDGLRVALYGDTFATLNPSFQWGFMLDQLAVALSADYVTSGGDRLDIAADSLSLYDASVAGRYPPVSLAPGSFREERERLDASVRAAYGDFTLHGRVSDKTWGPFLTDSLVLNHDSEAHATHAYAALDFQRFFTQRLHVRSTVYADLFQVQQHERFAEGITLDAPLRAGESYSYPDGILTDITKRGWRFGAELAANYRLLARNDLTVGLAYEYLDVHEFDVRTNAQNAERDLPPEILYPLDELLPDVQTSLVRSVVSLFAQDTWLVRRNIDLTIGLRGDVFSDFGGVLTPKVGLTYRPDPRLNIKAMFGSAFRVPALYETFLERAAQGSAARDDLVVESLGTFEIGAGYKPFDWLLAEVNFYLTEIRQLAESTAENHGGGVQVAPAGSERVYSSIGGINVQGIEAEIRGEQEQDLQFGVLPRVINSSFRLNYSYQDAWDSESGAAVPYLARHKGNLEIGLRFSSVNSRTGAPNLLRLFRSVSDEFSWYAHLFLSGERRRAADDVRGPLPAYAVCDTTFLAHDVITRGLDLSVSIRNLFNTQYRDPGPEFAPDAPTGLVPDDYPRPGRAFWIEVRYRF